MDRVEANESVAGAQGTITVAGTTYVVNPVTEQAFATLSKWMRKRLADPLAAIAGSLAGLPKHLQEIAVREAVQLKAGGGVDMTSAYIQQQLFEPEPCAFLLWTLIRGNHPTVTLEGLTAAVTTAGAEQVLADLYEAAGLSALEKNGNGRTGS